MRWHRCLVPLLIVLTSCGDGRTLSADGTTTTDVNAVVRQPKCAPPGPPPPGYVRPDAESKHAALAPDLDVIQAYGRAHPDEFTSAGYEHNVGQRLLAYFDGHLDEHRAAIAALVANPNDFEVRQGVHSFRESNAVAEAIQNDDRLRGEFGSVTYGSALGTVKVNFRSTSSGRTAADVARDRWGDGVCVEIAGHPYPKDAWPDTSACEPLPKFDTNDDLELSLELAAPQVARGTIVEGSLRVANNGTESLSWPGGAELGAYVLEPRSGDPVGVLGSGGATAPGMSWVVAPGETIAIPVRFGTDDCRADSDYALPDGKYDVVAGLTPNGGSARTTLEVT